MGLDPEELELAGGEGEEEGEDGSPGGREGGVRLAKQDMRAGEHVSGPWSWCCGICGSLTVSSHL